MTTDIDIDEFYSRLKISVQQWALHNPKLNHALPANIEQFIYLSGPDELTIDFVDCDLTYRSDNFGPTHFHKNTPKLIAKIKAVLQAASAGMGMFEFHISIRVRSWPFGDFAKLHIVNRTAG